RPEPHSLMGHGGRAWLLNEGALHSNRWDPIARCLGRLFVIMIVIMKADPADMTGSASRSRS
ncbi:hypothetical protein, partial [Tenggerimyces flavus]